MYLSFYNIILFGGFFGLFINPSIAQNKNPVLAYTMIELVCLEGYHIQEHTVTTQDGYILTIYRIPNNKKRPKMIPKSNHYKKLHFGFHPDFAECVEESLRQNGTGPPVLIAHGIFAASDGFILQGPGNDLAYLLVDEGYDVWFTNTRGNFYSRNHTTLDCSDPKFWNFSFHEAGFYDIPAIIDFVLKTSGHKKLTYIGHSMGTTMFFVALSTRPEYNDKVNLFLGLTPTGQVKKAHFSKRKTRSFALALRLAAILNKRGVKEVLPRNQINIVLSEALCGTGYLIQNLCYDLFFSFVGYHSKLFLRKKFALYLSHGLSGNSMKTILHYEQLLLTPSFRHYNYGPEENIRRYGQVEPPDYDLRKVVVPAALYYSYDDYIVDVKDVGLLMKLLPNIVETLALVKYSHVDFLWAYNSKELVYRNAVKLIQKYSSP